MAEHEGDEVGVSDGFTIGEVLGRLKDDFEDITISKIRFLESEGLIFPARTESGYRKFTDDDVDRLRFILTAQRDHFLPLKVIREQLDRVDKGEATDGIGPPPPGSLAKVEHGEQGAALAQALEQALSGGDRALLETSQTEVSLSLREFCQATGLQAAEVRDLKEYGLIGSNEDGPYDADDLLAGRAARELLRAGLQARHLRMERGFAQREVALLEQLIAPLARQRSPEARRQAVRQLENLAGAMVRLHRSLLAHELRGIVRGS